MNRDYQIFFGITMTVGALVFAFSPPQNYYDLLQIPAISALLYWIIRAKRYGFIH